MSEFIRTIEAELGQKVHIVSTDQGVVAVTGEDGRRYEGIYTNPYDRERLKKNSMRVV